MVAGHTNKKMKKSHFSHGESSRNHFNRPLIVCQLFCAAPVFESRSLVRLHKIWCTTFFLAIFSASCSQAKTLKIDISTIQKALYMSEYVTNSGLVLLTILTTYFHKDCYKTFPKRIHDAMIRTRLFKSKVCHQRTPHAIYRKALAVLVLGTIFCLTILFMDYYYKSENSYLFVRSSLVYTTPNITISLLIGQYWVLMKFIVLRYREVNIVLDELNNRKTKQTWNSVLTDVWQIKRQWNIKAKLDDLRNIFANLDGLVQDVISVFGVTITFNFLASFLTLSIQVFVLYKISERGIGNRWALLPYTFIWIAFHVGKFIIILQVNSCFLEEKANTAAQLNDYYDYDTEVEEAISRFLMQLLVKADQLACGIIRLDMVFFKGVLSGLSIYVIFLIQVDLGEVSLTGRATLVNATTPTPHSCNMTN